MGTTGPAAFATGPSKRLFTYLPAVTMNKAVTVATAVRMTMTAEIAVIAVMTTGVRL